MKTREVPFRELHEENRFVVRSYSEELAAQWDEFVWQAHSGTLFHTRKFLSYHPPGRFVDHSLIFTRGDHWVAVLPAVVRDVDGCRSLVSHAGASYGGLILSAPPSIKDSFRLVDRLVSYARDRGFGQIVMTLPPQIYCTRPNNYLDFALLESGFRYLKREISSVIPLDFAEEDTLLKFTPASRRAVKKARSHHVEIRESDDFARFYAILKQNLKLRHNVEPTHSLTELRRLKKLFPDDIRLFAAFKGADMIAGIVLFVCNPRVALAFYISHDEAQQAYRGVNLLFHEVIRWCIRKRFKFLDFGIFTVNMKVNWGLARFKESFGALGVFRDTFVCRL